ncbi:carbohydrate-binding protein [Streptomyces sudanensis]|uniref:carbohydrate-binding protein n=1 Tax=Streptomyces sudanensis TaxID=436397 RepID=UPI0020CD4EB0|nr:carbohydrate-binding protein [Streptomyces sudanensis]MCP9958427.1 carbohydrate-binding protein [Streptomyces sudanensis]MCP9987559.1 carbohydrate-binding protein [Streptomyces sudanensis]
MAAGNQGNGEGTPEDDDPFGYLYADGQASGAQRGGRQGGYGYPGPAGAQPGRPRTSYNQVRAVGERPRPQVPPQSQAPYGQQPGTPYGQPHPQYAAPETYPGGAPARPVPARGGGRGGRNGGPNTRGLLIGAIAVVLVVVAGIAVAFLTNKSDEETAAPDPAPSVAVSQSPEEPGGPSPSSSPEQDAVELPKRDAATLQLTPPAVLGTAVKGAQGAGGAYVTFNGVGGAASWKVDVPQDGPYTLFLTYSVPGKDAKTSLTVNDGKPRKINMSNFARAPQGDWEKGWTRTYSWVQLKKGENDLKMSCEPGDQCEAYLDQVWLKSGQVSSAG